MKWTTLLISPPQSSLVLRFLETASAAIGLACLATALAGWWRYESFQAHAFSMPRLAASTPIPVSSGPQLLGIMRVVRLHLSTAMVEGADDDALALGVGHMRETAAIGSDGNAVLAGHRDTSFWPLRNVRQGDVIDLQTNRRYRYVVESTTVVRPEETTLLAPTKDAVLTVVTCYPFRHVGPAPKRFIIRARLLKKQA